MSDHLTHLTPDGKARMVDVSQKQPSARTATARASVQMSDDALQIVMTGGLAKGDAFTVAQIAGVMAAKKTSELIPLCHPLSLTDVDVQCLAVDDGVEISATVKTMDRTGVEMEAMVAASVAALTLYDMCKAVDKSISITSVELVAKTGGKSGDFKRE